ncbi:hypothetical protein T4B_1681 [Trichinella pseudospiralis]|uniref:Uncharacterized protein n=1 Tax=Trichinella pseudospiralis TaxID=6337 RepID=A0A0V1DQF0_TRIPS|nr:hypothetical protein T4A_2405 [Trichinella pseudospiralis]KRY97382.1 hypothetical protein T4B_1681 [Trichinella pseudospiralis]
MNAHTSSVLAVNHQYIKNEKQKCNKSKTSRTIHSKGIGEAKWKCILLPFADADLILQNKKNDNR